MKTTRPFKNSFFWRNNLIRSNSRVLYPYQVSTVFISSDASNHALPAQFLKEGREYICFKNFSEYEIKQSSTWRELFAIKLLHSFASKISNNSVHWETDNYAASLIVASGSNKEHLQTLAEDIYELTIKYFIVLQVKWIPWHKKQIADALSKYYDFDDWETTDTLLHYLNRLWGPFTIDRFAKNKNANLKKFSSKFWCPNTSQVDAFTKGRENDNNYLVPTTYLVPKAIKHLQSSKGQGTLVVPFWPSASFWPFLQSYASKDFNSYVVDFKLFTQPHQCFQLGNNKSSLIGSSKFRSYILACSLDFRENK